MSASFKGLKRTNYLWQKADCQELLSVLAPGSIQLIVSSPPYNIQKDYEEKLDLSEYLIQQQAIIENCKRVLSDSGSICWQVGNYVEKGEIIPLDILLFRLFQQQGFKLRNRIVWHFEHGLHSKHRFSGRYETILWFTKTDDYKFNLDPVRVPQKYAKKKFYKGPNKGQLSCNPLGKNPGDIWKITNIKNGHPEKVPGGHPCQMPLELVDRLVLGLSEFGDKVLDPFGGTATTLLSALRHGRIAMGTEIDARYHKIGKKRIEQLLAGKLPIKKIKEDTILPFPLDTYRAAQRNPRSS